MVLYVIILAVFLTLIAMNTDQLNQLKSVYFELWLIIIINILIVAADALMMFVYRRIVTISNFVALQRIQIIFNLFVNGFTIWALAIYLTDKRKKVLNTDGFNEKSDESMNAVRILVQSIIFMRVVILFWYSLLILFACITISLYVVLSITSGDLSIFRRNR